MPKKSKGGHQQHHHAVHHQHSNHGHHAHPHNEHHQHHTTEQIHHTEHHSPATGKMIEEKILDNLVTLQKVHTSVAEKFDKLSNQLVHLLNLFEMTAKSFASNPVNMVTERDKDFLEKIDKLLEQNKTIAKGLTLMEERIRERVSVGAPAPPRPPQIFQPQVPMLPPQPHQFPSMTSSQSEKEDEYEPSSLSRPLPKF